MLYKIKMTSGHTIQLRGVRKFEYDAKAARFTAVLPGWSKYVGNGVEHIDIDDDPEWWGATVAIIDPKNDTEAVAFDPEKISPRDIKMDGENGRSNFGCSDSPLKSDEIIKANEDQGRKYKDVLERAFPYLFRGESNVPRELIKTNFAPVDTLPKNPVDAIPLNRFLSNFH